MSRRGGKRGGKGRRAAAVEEEDDAPQVAEEQAVVKISPRVVTGVLSSHPMSRDIKIDGFSLRLGPVELLMDTSLELNHGRRYGLIGLNGSGKSTLLDCIAEREVPVPAHIDIFHLRHEIAASDTTALEAVVEELENKRIKLEAEAEELAGNADQHDTADLITEIYERLDELEVSTAESRAAEILYGLGFTPEMQRKATREFSGGWRMRISLAKALFIKPTMLLLDEPTNHLDLEATVWLEKYLQNYNRILVLVSHSQDFLNNVCTNIMRIHLKRLTVGAATTTPTCRLASSKRKTR
jgi:ATP-binding cassette subfamily F protein 2